MGIGVARLEMPLPEIEPMEERAERHLPVAVEHPVLVLHPDDFSEVGPAARLRQQRAEVGAPLVGTRRVTTVGSYWVWGGDSPSMSTWSVTDVPGLGTPPPPPPPLPIPMTPTGVGEPLGVPLPPPGPELGLPTPFSSTSHLRVRRRASPAASDNLQAGHSVHNGSYRSTEPVSRGDRDRPIRSGRRAGHGGGDRTALRGEMCGMTRRSLGADLVGDRRPGVRRAGPAPRDSWTG